MEDQDNRRTLVGIVGMPGSGKSKFLSQDFGGFVPYDDVGGEDKWWQILQALKQGKPVVFSDIEFCNEDRRLRLEEVLECRATWIFFENNPLQCVMNCMHRWIEKRERPIIEEMMKIERLTRIYRPTGEIKPVFVAPCNCPTHCG